jgi:hypothetical protein
MDRLLDTSSDPSKTIPAMSTPYPVVIDSGKLKTTYIENDPTGYAAGNSIKIKIPNWTYRLVFSDTGSGIAVSATKNTSTSSMYLIYDSFNFGTVSTPFYGDTDGLLSAYDWRASASAPSSASLSVIGTYWIDLNLDSNTFNLNGLDYIGFSSKTYPYSYKYPANINTYMSLGTTIYSPDTSVFKDPDLHYLNINSAVLQFPDPIPQLVQGPGVTSVYTRTRSYIDVVSSFGASGVEMSALFERLDGSEVLLDTQKASIIAYIDDEDKSPNIVLNGAVTAGDIVASTIRLSPAVDLSATSTQHNFQIGVSTGLNLRIDNNEIEVLNNGVGATLNLNGAGSGTVVFGGLLGSNDTYANDITTTRRAMWISSAGVFGYASSSRTKKQDIVPAEININSVLSVEPKRFRYIKAVEQFGNDAPIELGMIAEDLHDAGLTHFVDYGPDGDIQGIHYSTYVVALQAVVRDLAARVAALESR